jgi:hypothetical protein
MTFSLGLSNAIIRLFDAVPNNHSAEQEQNSEPSVTVDPLDPEDMILGAFGPPSLGNAPYYISTDGGATWSDYGTEIQHDKSLAWLQDGSAALTVTLNGNTIATYSGTTGSSDFGSRIGSFTTPGVDQPWIRTGPSNHVYVGYNDDTKAKGAAVLVSTDGGHSYTNVVLDRVGAAAGQDSPQIRLAVNGNTVYSVFTRWDAFVDTDAAGDSRYLGSVVIERSDNGGADGFTALGSGGNGVTAATPITVFSAEENAPLTLGLQGTAGDVAIAVDPNDASHVVIAYADAPGTKGSGNLLLHVAESTDSGATWVEKFTTDSSARSALPGLAILDDGAIGLLYASFDPASQLLSQHLLTTTTDFATTTDTTLGVETNPAISIPFDPYLGDFYDLTSVGNTFYGTFSASNADDGANALIRNASFDRDFTGTAGTSSFQLVNRNGNSVGASIDPYVFRYTLQPAPADFSGDGTSEILWRKPGAQLDLWSLNAGTITSSVIAGSAPDASWSIVDTGDFNGDGKADLLWRNTNGALDVALNGSTDLLSGFVTSNGALVTPDASWSVAGVGDLEGDHKADVVWRNTSGEVSIWLMNGSTISTSSDVTSNGKAVAPDASWSVAGMGDFNGDGKRDILWRDTSGEVAAWMMNGTTIASSGDLTFGGPAIKPDASWSVAGIGDFNGDGNSDVLWHNANGSLNEWLMNGTTITASDSITFNGATLAPDASWHLVDIGDFNGDGLSDMLWRNDSGAMAEWLMNGSTITASLTPNVGGSAIDPAAGWQTAAKPTNFA